ncbi:family 78 glycoside hydrolase catalytic domain [Mucilaginibacter sp. cycad4]|uniref:alpha-L-rhamnosidase n=1 Tax=Mucilaginibacter sp. cycad4 TaxID=3342096 RepID=UPI002AAA9180|nr:family 78 glycoside hydrolase catalytic domain [Mucilaginibacter gossypii]WPV00438.1 family 78 glycoside hydrolase catalytic domain [Mucilaginibacter gossypii]
MKHPLCKPLLSIALLFCFFSVTEAQTPGAAGLKSEYLINPIGIDNAHPRLTWLMDDKTQGAAQSAYQLFVGTDSIAVSAAKGNAWATTKIASSTNLAIYSGRQLKPFTKYFWKVQLWDQTGKKLSASPIVSFETGMMGMQNWKGSWISDNKGIAVNPAPYFRNTFKVAKPIRSARAYIAVAGLYELYLNGKKIGNHRLDPMYTRFDRRTLYVSYDVTAQLQSGKNAVGVLLGNGWYNHQSTAVWFFHQAPWRGRPVFCMDLRITYTDGSVETVKSGTDWKTSLSPVVFNSIYTAEHYDGRLEQPGWNTANFDDKKWKPVINRAAPSMNIVSQTMQPIRAVDTISTKSVTKIDSDVWVFDMGRNISGVSQITVKGDSGTVIRLKHAERLNKNGHVDQSNIDLHYRPTDDKDPFQTDIFILGGKGEETFSPRFNYKGFQYIEVSSSKPIQIDKENIKAFFMHSDVEPIGTVKASNQTINQIWTATNNSYLSNLFGYPTDCPQREKNGWTGDAHIASETGLYNFDGITVYEKWLADHRDEQQPNGVLPSIIPTGGWGYEWGNGPDWTSTIAIIPYNIYLFYGDSKLLADSYNAIEKYVNHIDELYPTGLTTWGLGDWVPVKSVSPVELTSSVYYYTDATILAKAAKILGKQADYVKYTALANKIKNAINAKYLDTATGTYGKGLQTELSVPLYWGIVPENMKSKVAANLAKRVAADNFHLDVGILGAKAILSALSDNGYADVAYKIASQETFPSWGWWMVNGATTLYENWQIDAKSDISLNHIMFGEIGAWLYKGIAGIHPDPEHPGFKNVLLQPHFVPGLNEFTATHKGPYGNIVSSWQRTGNGITYKVTVPANSTATITFPAGKVYLGGKPLNNPGLYKVAAGSYVFEIK